MKTKLKRAVESKPINFKAKRELGNSASEHQTRYKHDTVCTGTMVFMVILTASCSDIKFFWVTIH